MASQPLNDPAEIPRELDRWNWGAFFLNWIWGIGNSTLIALLALIPGINFIMMIVLGLRGSRWAWRNRYWRDAEHFRKTQRRWAIAGLAIWIIVIGGVAGLFASIVPMMKRSEAYQMSMEGQAGARRRHHGRVLGVGKHLGLCGRNGQGRTVYSAHGLEGCRQRLCAGRPDRRNLGAAALDRSGAGQRRSDRAAQHEEHPDSKRADRPLKQDIAAPQNAKVAPPVFRKGATQA